MTRQWKKGVKFLAFPETPIEGIFTKFGIRIHIKEILNCATFFVNRISDFDFVGEHGM